MIDPLVSLAVNKVKPDRVTVFICLRGCFPDCAVVCVSFSYRIVIFRDTSLVVDRNITWPYVCEHELYRSVRLCPALDDISQLLAETPSSGELNEAGLQRFACASVGTI